jgi:choline dehydrogenase
VLLTLHSTRADRDGPPDLHVFTAGPFDTPDGAVFGIVTGLMAPRSRGSVRLRSADPADPPVIDPAYLRHPDDVARMVEATLAARRISRTRPLVDLVAGPEIAPGPAVDDDDAGGLAESICRRVGPYHHPVGTCAMGAVVDARGALHGITGVLVADASIMPTIPSANTNASAIVVAERIASAL